MKVWILCSDQNHPILPRLENWSIKNKDKDIKIVNSISELGCGGMLLLISCHEILHFDLRNRFDYCLVVHASDLPSGRGWSPHVWSILEGADKIFVSLLRAEDELDSGDILSKVVINLNGGELHDEINELLFDAEISLIDFAVNNAGSFTYIKQNSDGATYYRRRTPEDSEIDPKKSIADQFDLLRVCDPKRYPAFFYIRGARYDISISKSGIS